MKKFSFLLYFLLSLTSYGQLNHSFYNFSNSTTTPPAAPTIVHQQVDIGSGNLANIFIQLPEGYNTKTDMPVLFAYLGDGTDNNATTVVTGQAMSTSNDLTYTFTPSLGSNRLVSTLTIIRVNGTLTGVGLLGGSITGTGITTGTCGSLTSATPTISVTFSTLQTGNTITVDYTHSAVFFEGVPMMGNLGDRFRDKGIVVSIQQRGNNVDYTTGYFDAPLTYLWNNYSIDPNRVNTTGLSRGGRFVLRADLLFNARNRFWINESDGTISATDLGAGYVASGIASVSWATGQMGGTYTNPDYLGKGMAGVMGTNDNGFGSVQNPNYQLSSDWGAQTTYTEFINAQNIWAGTHSASVWHNQMLYRMYSGVSGRATAPWDYIDWHWRYSLNDEDCATLFVETAEARRSGTEIDIIDYREAVRKVAQLSAGAVKTALEARLVSLKSELDSEIDWRVLIENGTSTVNYTGAGYNTMTLHTDNQRVDDLVNDNNTTLTGVDFFIGNNPLTSNFQAEIGSNRGRNFAGGFPSDVNRAGFRINNTSGVCPMGFDGLTSGTYIFRAYANEGSGGFTVQRELTATINGVTNTQYIQGNTILPYVQWTGDETDFASFSLGANGGDIYITALELIKVN